MTHDKIMELIGRMTPEEKLRQLTAAVMGPDPEKLGLEQGLGGMAVMSTALLSPEEATEYVRRIQDYVLSHSEHKIPVLFHCETLSGPHIFGSFLFPAPVGLGASFSPELVQDMGDRCRRQMLAVGIRQGLAPVLDVLRDLRWGRCGETYGGDPTLCGALGTAFVKGLQGRELKEGVSATLKHFLGYSCSSGGLNMSRIVTDHRDLRENFAKPFEMAIREGQAKCVMNSYNEYEGLPVCANEELLTGLLRQELGFTGVTVSDYGSMGRLIEPYKIAETTEEAGEKCLKAGLDMEFPAENCFNRRMAEDIRNGRFPEQYVDDALERVLTLKNELGLFENPYPAFDMLETAFDNGENNRKSLEAAIKSIVMTKNDGMLLPVRDRKKKIAVIGPVAGAVRALYFAYSMQANVEMLIRGECEMAGAEFFESAPSAKESGVKPEEGNNAHDGGRQDLHIADDMIRRLSPEVKTVYEALAEYFPDISYTEGCDYADENTHDFQGARKAAASAELVILSVGGRNGFGASCCTSGEGVDNTDTGLPGCQEQLVREVFAVNPNIILVHTDCRPIVSEWIYEHIPAVLEAWLPGTFGGCAIAQIITGRSSPGGRLPLDVPRNSGHGPVAYYMYRGTEAESFRKAAINPRGYRDADLAPRLPFGYGLSYTAFEYSDFMLEQKGESVCIRVTVCNTGNCRGDEVVQLYGSDPAASVVRPAMVLLGFRRVALDCGQRCTVEFRFDLSIMAFYDVPGHWILEAGEYLFLIGKNSREFLFRQSVTMKKTKNINSQSRCLIAETEVYGI